MKSFSSVLILYSCAGFPFRGEHLWIVSCYDITFRWVFYIVVSESFNVSLHLKAIHSSHLFFRHGQTLQCGGVSLQTHVSQGVFTILRNSKSLPYSQVTLWCWAVNHIFLWALFCFNLRFLYLSPLSCLRFLGCSFVTSAVRRGAGQEVESLRWRSNTYLCTIDAFNLPSAFPLLSVHWSINITSPSVSCTPAKMQNTYIGLSPYIYIYQM